MKAWDEIETEERSKIDLVFGEVRASTKKQSMRKYIHVKVRRSDKEPCSKR